MTLTLVTLAADPIDIVTCCECSTAAIQDEADSLGWAWDEDRAEWECEDCHHAPTAPRLLGMRAP